MARIGLFLSPAWGFKSGPPAPLLADVSVPFGRLTAPGQGWVNLADLMTQLGTGTISTWSMVYEPTMSTLGAGGANHFTTDATNGRTPTVHASRPWSSISGTYVWRVTATGPGGTAVRYLTYTTVADAANFGNQAQNWPEANLYTSAAAWYNAPYNGRQLLASVGMNRPAGIQMNNGWTFPTGGAKVQLRYADPARPPQIRTWSFGLIQNANWDGISFKGTCTGVNAHIQAAFVDCTITNCLFVNTEAEFSVGPNPGGGWASIATSDSTNGLIVSGCRFRHQYFAITGGGSQVQFNNNRVDKMHRVGVFIGNVADHWYVRNNIFTNPWRTHVPSLDTGSHLDWIQVADASATACADFITVEYNVFVMGNANSGLRGVAGSGASGTNRQVENWIFRRNIMTVWDAYIFENYGSKGANVLEGNAFFLMLTGDESTAIGLSVGKDLYANGPRINIGRVDTLAPYPYPTVPDTFPVGSTWYLNENFVQGDTDIIGEALSNGVVTTTASHRNWLRNPAHADVALFVNGHPQTKLESYPMSLWESDNDAAILQACFDAFKTTTGVGPVNLAGTGFNA